MQIELLTQQGLTKSEVASLATQFIDSVLETGAPLNAAIHINNMMAFAESITKDKRFKDYVLEELAKEGNKYTSNTGTKIEKIEAGTKYDYSCCGDPVLQELIAAAAAAQDKLKERQDFLKSIPTAGQTIITDDGESVTVYPPSKSSTTTFKITTAK